jgi:hypothetical protein
MEVRIMDKFTVEFDIQDIISLTEGLTYLRMFEALIKDDTHASFALDKAMDSISVVTDKISDKFEDLYLKE